MKWLLLAALVLFVVFAIGVRVGGLRSGNSVAFVPVTTLPEQVRREIDLAIAQNRKILAIKIYREATEASLASSKAAIDVYAAGLGR